VKCNIIRDLVNGGCSGWLCVELTESRLLEYTKLFLTHLQLRFFFYGNLCKDVCVLQNIVVIMILKVVVDGETATYFYWCVQDAVEMGEMCEEKFKSVGTEALMMLPSPTKEGDGEGLEGRK
jgi:hypothetical protein